MSGGTCKTMARSETAEGLPATPVKQSAPSVWGKTLSTPLTMTAAFPAKAKTFAEIMAEESESRAAAQAAYDMQHMSLAEMEAEQERIFLSFQNKQGQVGIESTKAAPIDELKAPSAPSYPRYQGFSQRALDEIEHCEAVVNNPNNDFEEERRREGARVASARAPPKLLSSKTAPVATEEPDWLAEARDHLSEQEILEIERALRESELGDGSELSDAIVPPASVVPTAAVSLPKDEANTFLSFEESAAIEAALREADAKQEEESFLLAMQMQEEEIQRQKHAQQERRQRHTGNVRSMTRAQYAGAMSFDNAPPLLPLEEQEHLLRADTPRVVTDSNPPRRHPMEETEQDILDESAGFRMNSANAHEWARRDRNTIIGPNNEIRTKHDVQVQGQANAQVLGLEEDDFGLRTHVGNQAFNSFKKSMKRTTKGVASHGTGRAGTDSDAVKGKAMDPHVRTQITKAINNGLIEHCNGAVKQGKEAVVYHADKGAESQGHDVAVKVFKRITEFRGRGAYVDGDPRYIGQPFNKNSEREQLELWAEKEFRNLVRANQSKVPVPTPLHYKENVIFMRFLGNDGWPAPQIREIEMRKGSKRWDILYTQVMEAVRRLYSGANLVHGDLSEYNILVAPTFQVDNVIESTDDIDNDLQTVLIDFGQAVDVRHPESEALLRRDLDRVRTFFIKQGVKTLGVEDALQFVKDQQEEEDVNNKEDADVDVQGEAAAVNPVEAMS